MQLTGAEIIIECLKEQGVDTVFGYPGGAILNVYDALYKHKDEITHVLTSHEQGASHAADGYARATGKVGVCFATSGPGATNLVTGIATAYMDSVPVVAITCNVGNALLGKDSFQEVDIAGIVMPVTKHSYIVKDITKLADTLRNAFYIAKSGRPGPVLVDVTKDVTGTLFEYSPRRPATINRETENIRKEDVDTAVEMIRASKKPYIFVGGGSVISGASKEITELAHKLQAPVCDSLMGKGAFSGEDPLYTGMLGMHGTKTSDLGVTQCDLLIVLGARFSDRVTGNAKTFAKQAKILQLDVDAAEIDKNVQVDASIVGDVRESLRRILEKLPEDIPHPEWIEHIQEMKAKYPLSYDHSQLTGPYIIEKLYELTNGEAIISTDVGQHQMWAAQYYKYKEPRTFLTSGGLGTMGYGFPGGVGAKIGNPDKPVIVISGDGGMQMNIQEFATAVLEELPLILCVFNNEYLGMVRQWQKLFYGKRYSMTNLRSGALSRRTNGEEYPEYTPDFVKLAESYGAKGIRVFNKTEVAAAFEEAKKNTKVPTLIEFVIDPEEMVYPMIKPGGTLEDLIMDC